MWSCKKATQSYFKLEPDNLKFSQVFPWIFNFNFIKFQWDFISCKLTEFSSQSYQFIILQL